VDLNRSVSAARSLPLLTFLSTLERNFWSGVWGGGGKVLAVGGCMVASGVEVARCWQWGAAWWPLGEEARTTPHQTQLLPASSDGPHRRTQRSASAKIVVPPGKCI